MASDVGKVEVGTMPEGGFILYRPTEATISVWKSLMGELDARLQPYKGSGTENIAVTTGSDQFLLSGIMERTTTLNAGWIDPNSFLE